MSEIHQVKNAYLDLIQRMSLKSGIFILIPSMEICLPHLQKSNVLEMHQVVLSEYFLRTFPLMFLRVQGKILDEVYSVECVLISLIVRI